MCDLDAWERGIRIHNLNVGCIEVEEEVGAPEVGDIVHHHRDGHGLADSNHR